MSCVSSPLSSCSEEEEEESDEDAEHSCVRLLSLERLCVLIGRLGCQLLLVCGCLVSSSLLRSSEIYNLCERSDWLMQLPVEPSDWLVKVQDYFFFHTHTQTHFFLLSLSVS